jgi:hypothetical protein
MARRVLARLYLPLLQHACLTARWFAGLVTLTDNTLGADAAFYGTRVQRLRCWLRPFSAFWLVVTWLLFQHWLAFCAVLLVFFSGLLRRWRGRHGLGQRRAADGGRGGDRTGRVAGKEKADEGRKRYVWTWSAWGSRCRRILPILPRLTIELACRLDAACSLLTSLPPLDGRQPSPSLGFCLRTPCPLYGCYGAAAVTCRRCRFSAFHYRYPACRVYALLLHASFTTAAGSACGLPGRCERGFLFPSARILVGWFTLLPVIVAVHHC